MKHLHSVLPLRSFPACVFAFLTVVPAKAQWNQVNNGLSTLDYGAATHGTTPTHVFARAYNVLYRSADQVEHGRR
ncbi:MAG: hypothetical protein IPG92_16005 [Flavobacteriales bacterium]|nr:hypothetical protein [Flavobacteriales bacterium]